jgi:hypothetical protein
VSSLSALLARSGRESSASRELARGAAGSVCGECLRGGSAGRSAGRSAGSVCREGLPGTSAGRGLPGTSAGSVRREDRRKGPPGEPVIDVQSRLRLDRPIWRRGGPGPDVRRRRSWSGCGRPRRLLGELTAQPSAAGPHLEDERPAPRERRQPHHRAGEGPALRTTASAARSRTTRPRARVWPTSTSQPGRAPRCRQGRSTRGT